MVAIEPNYSSLFQYEDGLATFRAFKYLDLNKQSI